MSPQDATHHEVTETWMTKLFGWGEESLPGFVASVETPREPSDPIGSIPQEKLADALAGGLNLSSRPAVSDLASSVATDSSFASLERCVCPVPEVKKEERKIEVEMLEVKRAVDERKDKNIPADKDQKAGKRKKAEESKVSAKSGEGAERERDNRKKQVKKEKAKEEPAAATAAQTDESGPASEESRPERVLVKAEKPVGEIRTAAQRVKMKPEVEEAKRRKELHEKTRDELLREMLAEQQRVLGGS